MPQPMKRKEPPPRDRSLTRAQRRRLAAGRPEEEVRGKIGCKFCKSADGTYEKRGNRFICHTHGCKGSLTTRQLFDEELRGI